MFFFFKLCQVFFFFFFLNYLAVPGLIAVHGILDSLWRVGSLVVTCGF